MDGWMDGWANGWIDGWMDGWMGGWIDGWIGARTHTHTHTRTSFITLTVHNYGTHILNRDRFYLLAKQRCNFCCVSHFLRC